MVGLGWLAAGGGAWSGPVAGSPFCAAVPGAKLPSAPSTPPKRPPSGVPVRKFESSRRPVISTVMNRFK